MSGVSIQTASGNTIGGTTAAARNVISENMAGGVFVGLPAFGPGTGTAANNVVQGNYIGLDVTGTLPRGNQLEGLLLNNASNTLIGGTAPGAGNVFANNAADAIAVLGASSVNNTIQGNAIGTAADRVTPLGNFGNGVSFDGGASNNLVGGPTPGAGNLIANNVSIGPSSGNGIEVFAGAGNAFLGNTVFNNGLLGIDLQPGTNNNQAAPVLTSALFSSGNITIKGSLTSTPNGFFRIELFGNPTNAGQGSTFLVAVNVATDGSGVVNFSATVPLPFGVSFVTATATNLTTNSTSEFSPTVGVTAVVADLFASAGTGNRRAIVTVFNAQTGQVLFRFRPFGRGFRGTLRVATGDVNGDGVQDVIVGVGPGFRRAVKVFDGRTRALILQFTVGGRNNKAGVFVAAGDVNGDGFAEVAASTGPGVPGQVVVRDGKTGALLKNFFPFGRRYRNGIRVLSVRQSTGRATLLAEALRGGNPVVQVL